MDLESWITTEQLVTLCQVAGAMLLGGAIGMEREMANKPAGLRTHMLLGGAAAFVVGLSNYLVRHLDTSIDREALAADPIRIMVAIVTGVSFLGAGTILRRDDDAVEGLTTAASLLLTAVVGIAVALTEYFLAFAVTVLAVLTLQLLGRFEVYLQRRRGRSNPTVSD